MSFRASLLAAAFLVAAAATAADWPGFRGANRDAVSPETGLLKQWPKDGPPKAWTAKNLGLGWGSPSVVDGHVYGVGTRDGKDGVWALKESDGSEVWFRGFAEPAGRLSRQTNGPASTPTFHNGKLFAVSANGTLGCLDAKTGKVVWTKSYTKDFGGSVPSWGYTGSVLADGDKIIGLPGGKGAAVVALKADSGEVVWKSDVGDVGGAHGYSSPLKMTVNEVPMYVALLGTKSGVVGVHADTGKLLWQYKAKPATGGTAQIPTPIVRGEKVFVATSYGGGSALLQIVPMGKDAFEVKELKAYPVGEVTNHHGGMVLVGDYLYFGHGHSKGYPVCVDFKTGEVKWGPEERSSAVGGGSGSAAVAFADGRLYFRYTNGTMVLIDPSPEELKVVSTFKLPAPDQRSHGSSWPHPVIANGKLYIRDQTVMYCYDVKAGGN